MPVIESVTACENGSAPLLEGCVCGVFKCGCFGCQADGGGHGSYAAVCEAEQMQHMLLAAKLDRIVVEIYGDAVLIGETCFFC